MLFANKIRELRESKQLLQRHVSAALDMDNAMYCKIERGDRRAKREQIPMIAGMLQTDAEQLLVLWLADQLIATVADDKSIADKALKIAQQALTNNIQHAQNR
jgi:transcriptional regulator with XRE-family HTH domain